MHTLTPVFWDSIFIFFITKTLHSFIYLFHQFALIIPNRSQAFALGLGEDTLLKTGCCFCTDASHNQGRTCRTLIMPVHRPSPEVLEARRVPELRHAQAFEAWRDVCMCLCVCYLYIYVCVLHVCVCGPNFKGSPYRI